MSRSSAKRPMALGELCARRGGDLNILSQKVFPSYGVISPSYDVRTSDILPVDIIRETCMAPLISLFNHKGGVSKTTTAFNLGWALADRGERIMIVDADPQCNLTGTVVGFDKFDDISTFYAKHHGANISDCLEPIFKATGTTLQAARLTKTTNPNLFLLAGSIDLAESETQISVALSTREAIPALQNVPGSLCALLRMTAKKII
jgi:chromosome partitioning protein